MESLIIDLLHLYANNFFIPIFHPNNLLTNKVIEIVRKKEDIRNITRDFERFIIYAYIPGHKDSFLDT